MTDAGIINGHPLGEFQLNNLACSGVLIVVPLFCHRSSQVTTACVLALNAVAKAGKIERGRTLPLVRVRSRSQCDKVVAPSPKNAAESSWWWPKLQQSGDEGND